MSELRKEIHDCIDTLPDSKLEALRPLLTLLSNDTIIIETDLDEEEKEIIRAGRKAYEKGGFIPLDDIFPRSTGTE